MLCCMPFLPSTIYHEIAPLLPVLSPSSRLRLTERTMWQRSSLLLPCTLFHLRYAHRMVLELSTSLRSLLHP